MNHSEAVEITGGLSSPSKMPGYSFNLPATSCITGSKLCKQKGTVCSTCYARKGRYNFPNVKKAMQRRLEGLQSPGWVEAMVYLIKEAKEPYFRWHDSGDLQSVDHFLKILEVVKQTTEINHWLPTKEYQIVEQVCKPTFILPDNLCIRFSIYMIDEDFEFGKTPWKCYATCSTKPDVFKNAFVCPVNEHPDHTCGSCRACWNINYEHITYLKH